MKHSELNTADTLHYAKVRTFTGASSSVSPDFIDQLLVKSETKEQFIATGTNSGQLVKISGGADGSTSPPSSTAIDTATFLSKILVQNGQILTTNNDQIIFQE